MKANQVTFPKLVWRKKHLQHTQLPVSFNLLDFFALKPYQGLMVQWLVYAQELSWAGREN